ncbi:MAG: hypothetical protein ABIJ46_00790 [bacterium]
MPDLLTHIAPMMLVVLLIWGGMEIYRLASNRHNHLWYGLAMLAAAFVGAALMHYEIGLGRKFGPDSNYGLIEIVVVVNLTIGLVHLGRFISLLRQPDQQDSCSTEDMTDTESTTDGQT